MMLNRGQVAITMSHVLHFWFKMLKNPVIALHLIIVPAQLRNTKSLFPDINEVSFSSTIWIGNWTTGLKNALRPGQLLGVSNNMSTVPWRVILNHFSEQPVHLYLKIPNVSTIDDCWELDNYFQHPLINDLVYDTGRNCRTKESIIMHRH